MTAFNARPYFEGVGIGLLLGGFLALAYAPTGWAIALTMGVVFLGVAFYARRRSK